MNNIKEKIKKIIYQLNYKFLMKNIILMESNPDLSDNTYAIFEKLIEKNVNNKYQIIWYVQKDDESYPKIRNVKYLNINKHKFQKKYYNLIAKYIIDCNRYIKKMNKYQFRLHLTHGEWIKKAKDYANGVGKYDYIVKLSSFFDREAIECYYAKSNQIIHYGYPRNDVLLIKNSNMKKIINKMIGNDKIIIWMPTFRNHKDAKEHPNTERYMNIKFKYGVPCLNNKEELFKLNNLLNKEKITLLIKPHPAEDISELKEFSLSNIKIINDELLHKNGIDTYKILSVCEALITDYSSIYYDFLLTKKPIGLAISDLNEYVKYTNLYINNYQDDIVGEYIYNYNDLEKFIKNVANGDDKLYAKRMDKLKIYHEYLDNKSSERIVNFFLDKIGYESNEK